MTAALSLGALKPFRQVTITGSGFSNSTAYTLTITDTTGAVTKPSVTSDGSGAFTFTFTPQGEGALKVDARPSTEHLGTTSAAATVTGTVPHGEVR